VGDFWRPLQNGFGWKDPTIPAQSIEKRNKVELGIMEWARKNRMVAVAGHTHRPIFMSLSKQQNLAGMETKPYYFNSGSRSQAAKQISMMFSGVFDMAGSHHEDSF